MARKPGTRKPNSPSLKLAVAVRLVLGDVLEHRERDHGFGINVVFLGGL